VLIEFPNSGDRNVIKKQAEKMLKWRDLTIEIQHTCSVKTKVLRVIVGANVTISKSFRKYLSNVPGKHEIKELQKTATLGTANVYFEKY
jgi:ribosome-associated translation inhibitor RaiA